MVRACLMILLWLPAAVPAAESLRGEFGEAECIACHQQRDPGLVAGWRESRHRLDGQAVGCTACHGKRHETAAIEARRDTGCSQCHGGAGGAVAQSYAGSKHGVLNRIEANTIEWSKPLAPGNYRAPGCAYCHLPADDHRIERRMVEPQSPAVVQQRARQEMGWLCQQCHAPRFVAEQQLSGAEMVAAGAMKVREAAALLAQARKHFPGEQRVEMERLYREMEGETMQALRLGAGHQSPDYQWWHGHPALDGKLLRIKGELSRLQRGQAAATR